MKGVWERTHCPAESAWASGGGAGGGGRVEPASRSPTFPFVSRPYSQVSLGPELVSL